MHLWAPFVLLLAGHLTTAFADEPKTKRVGLNKAPANYSIFEHTLGAAYFIDDTILKSYDDLKGRIRSLRGRINDGDIDSKRARREITELQGKLETLLQTIEKAKLYIPGAEIHRRTETTRLALKPDDLLLVDIAEIEIRGHDGPDLECILEKTVLDDGKGGVEDDFKGIELIATKSSGKERFGFYRNVRDDPKFKDVEELQGELRSFPFAEYLDCEFPYVSLKGLTHQEGNRQIDIQLTNEQGAGSYGSEWRRHARLTLLVPKCRKVAVTGGLGRIKVHDLNAPLSVSGQGNRRYESVYEVVNLGGSLEATNLPFERVEGIHGSVKVIATAFQQAGSANSGPGSAVTQPSKPFPSVYRNIDGDLQLRYCKGSLTIGDVGGKVDVENDFGETLWEPTRELSQKADHRMISQGGKIQVHLGPKIPGALPLELFTQCGELRRGDGVEKGLDAWFGDMMFNSSSGDTVRRSWVSWTRHPGPRNGRTQSHDDLYERSRRVADALHNRPRSPGIDIINRGGTVIVGLPEASQSPAK
ncbi:hypothetical protein ACYOEI_03645 [Singulisphaera rosea]